MKITEVCINKPVLAWMMMIATVVFGLVAATRIGVSQFPDVDFPTITVSVDWPGATPEAVEQDVVELIEEAVMQVEGVKSVNSSSRQGSGRITIELDLSRNVDVALQDVQTKVAGVARRLPQDIDPPTVSKSNPEDQPIMWIGLSGPFSRQMLGDTARYRVKEILQTVPGVGEVIMGGYLERNVRIWVNADKLDAKGLTVTDVIAALRREHVEMPAGQLETGGREVNVRVLGEALDLDALRRIVVRESGGQAVYLQDVAMVEDGFEDIRRFARVEGEPAQGLGIKKQRGSNAVAVAQGVRAKMDEIRPTLPEGMQLGINFDSSRFIEESVTHIEFELLLAVLLTALVCWVFLGSLSSTLNVVLAIPMSLLGTVAIIYFLGFTLNTFTLLALSLCVGIVVDDAIMVMENIFRHAEEGKPMKRAAYEGTREIAFAALAATVAVIAIFVPVIFMEGIIGRFFLQFGVTLSIAVALSYVEAVTLAPARCARLLSAQHEKRNLLGRAMDSGFEALKRGYTWILVRSLKRPAVVLGIAALVFGGAIYVLMNLPGEFVPSQDQSRLMVRVTTAVGNDINETDKLFRKVEEVLVKKKEIQRAFVNVGGFGGSGANSGVVFVTLVPRNERAVSQNEFAAGLRRDLNAIPGVKAVVQDLSQQGFTSQRGFPVEFSVRGPDWDKLVELSYSLEAKMRATGKVVDLDSDYEIGQPELRIEPDRNRAADQQVSMDDIGVTLNSLVGGVRVGKFSQNGRRLDVRLRLIASQRSKPDDIKRLRVRAGDTLLPLSALVTQTEQPALQSIIRKDRERAISLFANVAPGENQAAILEYIERELSKDLPEGYRVVLGGASTAYRDSFSSLMFALVLGVIVAYMVLASQFNSFLHPITVLTILPLSIAGAAFALMISGNTLNIFSMIGLLLLMGIVKKNSIVLIDYTLQLKAGGMTSLEAVTRAGPVRLRPILMTSAATLMAAVPAAIGLGQGSEVRTPMAIGVIGGVLLSTVLSLLVVPCFYIFSDRVQEKLLKLRKRRPEEPPVKEDLPPHDSDPGETPVP